MKDFRFFGTSLRSGRTRGPGRAFKNMGGFALHLFEGFPGPPGPARPQKCTPQQSGQSAFKYPAEEHKVGDYPKGIPECFCWPSVLLEAWRTKAKKPHLFQKRVIVWPLFSGKCVVFGLRAPGLQKTRGKNHFGIPLSVLLTGYLKAVWPGFWGCVFEVWPAPGARESPQKCGELRPPPF